MNVSENLNILVCQKYKNEIEWNAKSQKSTKNKKSNTNQKSTKSKKVNNVQNTPNSNEQMYNILEVYNVMTQD